ncbi:tyrosine-type recombinase/integrase [Janthinobacterium sp. CG3]|uniref:tyrosine-type recombinase/integrase n=1 Tax=Janthinobacterium sp. CG3 TaxID=1075768 RepID=UPI0012F71E07|nr:tyrosine-type recombinase/integrase [Janthinobacterium sp. CG3]
MSPRTVRNGGKEARRFLSWCRAGGKDLRGLRFEDLAAYSAFLVDPQPAPQWISVTKWPRTDPRWRPFAGPLAANSHRQAIVLVRSLLSWACKARYLDDNPGTLLGRMQVTVQGTVKRHLSRAAISILAEAAERMPLARPSDALRRARARFLVALYYLTGIRLQEGVGADMGAISQADDGAWWLHVTGKGGNSRDVPVPAALLAEFQRYRLAFGLAALPAPREALPLLLTTRGAPARATSDTIYQALKRLFAGASAIAHELDNATAADRLQQASPHWLRHSAFTHQVQGKTPLKTVQLNAGHENISTTSRYLHEDDAARHAQTIDAAGIKPL